MRIGIHAGAGGRGDNALEELLAVAREAAAAGLGFWTPQLSDLDALTALAVVGRELPVLRVGTAVVPTYSRHPLTMAMQALTVQAATGGRLTLGVGLSHQAVVESVYGLSFAKPVRHMREYLEVLVPVLETGQVSFQGEEQRVQTISPIRVAGAATPPVLVAALGTQMLNLAGRLANGTVTWMVGPRTLGDHVVPTITRAATRAGRPSPSVVVGVPVSVTADLDATRERAAKAYGAYDSLPSYRAMLDLEGATGPADIAVVGSEEQVAAGLRRLADLGATEVLASLFGPRDGREQTLRLLAELADEAS